MDDVKVFAPNTISNVGCGYDVLGFPLEGLGDEVHVSKRNDSGLRIKEILGADLPLNSEKNVATIAIQALLKSLGEDGGFDVSITKSISPGSGLGSSACSSVAAVYAVNELMGRPFTKSELIEFAMEGERASSGAAHADNVAPSMLGGFTVVRSYDPLDVFQIPFPEELLAVVIFPNLEVRTEFAKKILPKKISLEDGVQQWGNMAGLISGLMGNDMRRIGKSMMDSVAEPVRKVLIPHYDKVKDAAMTAGAIGFNISGSGPTTFALSDDMNLAKNIRSACREVYQRNGIEVFSLISKINPEGAHVI